MPFGMSCRCVSFIAAHFEGSFSVVMVMVFLEYFMDNDYQPLKETHPITYLEEYLSTCCFLHQQEQHEDNSCYCCEISNHQETNHHQPSGTLSIASEDTNHTSSSTMTCSNRESFPISLDYLQSYDWDIFQYIDENQVLSLPQKVMWKNWLVDIKSRWNETLRHYTALVLQELGHQRRFRTVTEEETQSWIYQVIHYLTDSWRTIRNSMLDGLSQIQGNRNMQRNAKWVLMEWFLQHALEPYPDEEEKVSNCATSMWCLLEM